MTFENDLMEFGENILSKKRGITTEETTKIALVLPFLRILGLDVENPDELKAEYSADVGLKKLEKIDLALLIDNEVKMLIECKSANTSLNQNHLNQLLRYHSVSDVKIAVLTNGVMYRFYTDFDQPGRMSLEYFYELDLRNITDSDIETLELFRRENFRDDDVLEHVNELKYRMKIREAVIDEITNPSEDLIHMISKKVYTGVLNKMRCEFFKNIVRDEIKNGYENRFVEEEDIVTTPEELEGFYIVRAILSEVVDPSKITIRDRKSYCAVLFDDNHNYIICRLHFNDLDNLIVSLFDSMKRDKNGGRIDEKIRINRVSDIYRFKDILIKTVLVYERVKG